MSQGSRASWGSSVYPPAVLDELEGDEVEVFLNPQFLIDSCEGGNLTKSKIFLPRIN